MTLRRLYGGSGEAVPPQPNDGFLRFNFRLWGSESDPDVALSEIRAFLDFRQPRPRTFHNSRVWDPSINDLAPVVTRRSFRHIPSRRNAPPDVDRDNPPPAWFDQGFAIEPNGDPTLVGSGVGMAWVYPFTVAVPESAFPVPPFPQSLDTIVDDEVSLVLLQLVGRTTGGKQWFRDVYSLGSVANVNMRDRRRPTVQMTTRGWNNLYGALETVNSPVVFSGTVRDQALEGSGLSGAFLNVFDRGSIPERVYDFQQSIWRDIPQPPDSALMPAPHLDLDLDFVDPNVARFSARWYEPETGSGYYQASVHVLDNRGNEYSEDWTFLTDNEAPELQITVPAYNQTIVGPEALIEVEVSDDVGLSNVFLQIADNATGRYWNDALSAWNAAPSEFSPPVEQEGGRSFIRYQWNPAMDSGYFAIRLRAVDGAGNTSFAARTMHYAAADTVAPIVQIQRPANGSTHPSGSVSISGRVLDNVQVANVVLFIERVDMPNPTPNYVPTLALTPGPRGWHTWSHTLNAADLQGPGSYRVVAYALDTLENESETEKVFHLGPSNA